MSYCGQGSIVNPGPSAMRAWACCCKSWGCPGCAPVRAWKLGRVILAGQPVKLLTLTCNAKIGTSPEHRCHIMIRELPVLMKRAAKKIGVAKIDYTWTIEEHESGEPHMHVALRAPFIPQKWLSRQWRALTGAYIVDIRKVKKKAGLAKYLSKYMVKGLKKFGTCKRYSSTRTWDLDPWEAPVADGFWTASFYYVRRSQAELKRLWAGMGWDVAMEGKTLVGMARGPPLASGGAGG